MDSSRAPRSPSPASVRLHLAFLALSLAFPASVRAIAPWTATSTEKIRPGDPARPSTSAAIQAARNEFEAFQIALPGPLQGVTATASAFSGPAQLGPPRLFREGIITLASPSGPDGATGAFPDAMLPDVDDVVGEKRNAFPFDVPAGQTRVLWVEMHVPADAPAGDYSATVVIRATGQPEVIVPVKLTVWDFTLPSTSSLKSHFGLFYGALPAAHHVSGNAFSTLRARYAQLGLDHRISMGAFDDGVHGDFNHFDAFYGALIDGRAPTQLAGARLTSVAYSDVPSAAGYQSWATHFKARGWFDRLFDYSCDEPPSSYCAWDGLRARQAMVKQGDPAFRSLTTTNIQNATSNSVVPLIDLLVPVVNHMDDKAGNPLAGDQRPAYDAFLKQSSQKEVWMYQSCMSHGCGGTSNYFVGWVSYAIDASALRNRGMEWLSFKYDVTGELYYDTAQAYDYAAGREPWTNQWAYGGNGDGTFFYPGTPSAIGGQTDIPVASLRLKMLREGMEDFEYLKALSDAGEPTLAREIASALFPNPWTMPSVQDLFAARARMASKIVELKHRAGNVASSSGEPTSSSEPGVVSLPRPAVLRMRAGCSAGAGAEIVAALGLLTAVALRRRHRAR